MFSKPALMWEAAEEYFAWCEANTLPELDFVGKDGKEVTRPKMRSYTIEGLCRFLHVNTHYFNDFYDRMQEQIAKRNGKGVKRQKDFTDVITRIRETIFDQQYTGAASGFLVHHIVAAKLGLAKKTESRQVDEHGRTVLPQSAPTFNVQVYEGSAPIDENPDADEETT